MGYILEHHTISYKCEISKAGLLNIIYLQSELNMRYIAVEKLTNIEQCRSHSIIPIDKTAGHACIYMDRYGRKMN